MELNVLKNQELAGKKVLIRLDLNVPLKAGVITDDSRIKAAVPTIKAVMAQTNKIAIMSHLGRPKGQAKPEFSLAPIGERLAELLDAEVVFVEDYLNEPVSRILTQTKPNQIVLLENLRFHAEETKNEDNFARRVAEGFDFYINDAFGALHRAHASVVRIPEIFPKQDRAAGFLVEKEISALSGLLSGAEPPFTVIMGGAKVSDKIDVILSLLNKCNHLIIGGAMAYTFLKFKGIPVGASRVEADKMDLVSSIYRLAEERRVAIHTPVDHVTAAEFSESATPHTTAGAAIEAGQMGLDIGPQTLADYRKVILNSKTVLWNGPMGVFEWDAFAQGSLGVAQAMAACTGRTIIGGGDSVACVNKAGLGDKMTHVSTGGGASLEFLEGKVLPGVRVLLR